MVRFTEQEQEIVAQAKAAGTPAALAEKAVPAKRPGILASFLAYMERRQTEALLSRLDDHLREDIGLNPVGNKNYFLNKAPHAYLPHAY